MSTLFSCFSGVLSFFIRNRHCLWSAGYMLIYFSWFFHLEKTVTKHYKVIHMGIDDYIPFCEFFIIPYLLWFAYVAGSVLLLMFTDKIEYYRSCIFLFTGMTVFLIISTLWPNGQHLRPYEMPRDNIFTQLVAALYASDTPTNIWPSIHVYNSIGAHLAFRRSKFFTRHKWLRAVSFLLCVSIILSTVFLKQHSMFDVLTAFVMAFGMFILVYRADVLVSLQHLIQTRRKTSHRHKNA